LKNIYLNITLNSLFRLPIVAPPKDFICVINPNRDTTRYTYDDFGRVLRKSHRDLGTISYAYDNVGNVRFSQTQLQADSNRMTFTQYDDLNRPTVIGEVEFYAEELPSPGDRWTDVLDPTYLHDDGKSAILTANKTLWHYMIIVPGISSPMDSVTGCSFAADTLLLGESEAPVEPFLRHTAPVYTESRSPMDTAVFEDAQSYPDAIRMMVYYDAMPTSIGMWAAFPSSDVWDSLAPHKKVRNLRGHEAATAYREHGSQPFHYTVLSYDERGRVEALLRYTENLGFDAVYYSYNSMNQVTSVRVADPLRQYTTWYGYDYNGRVDSVWTLLQGPGSGLDVTTPKYPQPATRPLYNDINYVYTKTGQVDSMYYPPAAAWVDYHYNKRKWLDTLTASQTPPTFPPVTAQVFQEKLTYDSTGQITKQVWKHAGSSQQKQEYVYDAIQRLVGWKNTAGDSTFYQYDKIGNRNVAGRTGSGSFTATYNYDRVTKGPDQLQNMVNTGAVMLKSNYAYNPDGAVTGRRDTNITNGNQLQRVEGYSYGYRGLTTGYSINDIPNLNTQEWGYRYNAMGEREQKRLYSLTGILPHGWDTTKVWVYYLLGGSREQLAVYHGRETDQPRCSPPGPGVMFYPVEYNTFGIAYPGVKEDIAFVTTKPHAFLTTGTKEFKITDHLSSTRVTLSLTGVTSTYDYDPWGKLIASTGGKHRQGYNGREDDRESNLFSLGVRSYDDENRGSMLSVDPLWEKFSDQSPYVYSNNNPVNMTDPTGMQGDPVSPADELDNNPDEVGGAGCGGGGGTPMGLGQLITRAFENLLSSLAGSSQASETPDGQSMKGGKGPVLKGQQGVDIVARELKAQGADVTTEVTLQTKNGRTRPDIAVRFNNERAFVEVKNGPKARVSTNQEARFREVRESGATPRGSKAAQAGYTPGTAFGPTPVYVIELKWQ
jgi:RHS repeat-associated protein